MRKYRCYLRTVLLSILTAFVIDAIVNFDEYKKGWTAAVNDEGREPVSSGSNNLPVRIGKVTGMIFSFVFYR